MGGDLQLCELHAHSTWSDGALSIRELVDVYGRLGFDVLGVTDHVAVGSCRAAAVALEDWHAYVHEIDREAQRALREYGLLVIPGVELTADTADPDGSAHALALGLRSRPETADLVAAIRSAARLGAAVVAAHPYARADLTPKRPTRRFFVEHDLFRPLVHRWELFNRREVFAWVAEAGLPAIASGDVHRPEHVASWKTLLRCQLDEASVLAFLRSPARALLMPFDPAAHDVASIAA